MIHFNPSLEMKLGNTTPYQYRTSPLPPTHPVKALVGLARQIALPHEYEPERLPSFPALERTAKLGFNMPVSVGVPESATTKFSLFRQAAYPFWGTTSVTGTETYQATYDLAQGYGVTAANFEANYPVTQVSNITNKNTTASATQLGMSGVVGTTTFPHPFMAMDEMTGSIPWIYTPNNSDTRIVIALNSAPNAAVNFSLCYEVWDSPGECHAVTQIFSTSGTNLGAEATISLGVDAWIRPKAVTLQSSSLTDGAIVLRAYVIVSSGTLSYNTSSSTAGYYAVASATKTLFVPLVSPSEFGNSQLPWFSTRTTASAVLATNVTSVLNKAGTVLAGRVSPQVQSPWAVNSAYINTLHPAEKAYLPLETGLYTYCPPSTDLVNFWDYTLPSNSGALAATPVFRLDNDSLVNHFFLTSGTNASTLAFNVDWHIEFRTSSALFDVGMSTVTLETLHQAQIALASVGFFFENPEHSRILEAIMKAVRTYGPVVASAMNPVLGEFAHKGIDYVLSKIPSGKMKSTTVGASNPSESTQKKLIVLPPKAAAKRTKKNKKKKPQSQQTQS